MQTLNYVIFFLLYEPKCKRCRSYGACGVSSHTSRFINALFDN